MGNRVTKFRSMLSRTWRIRTRKSLLQMTRIYKVFWISRIDLTSVLLPVRNKRSKKRIIKQWYIFQKVLTNYRISRETLRRALALWVFHRVPVWPVTGGIMISRFRRYITWIKLMSVIFISSNTKLNFCSTSCFWITNIWIKTWVNWSFITILQGIMSLNSI